MSRKDQRLYFIDYLFYRRIGLEICYPASFPFWRATFFPGFPKGKIVPVERICKILCQTLKTRYAEAISIILYTVTIEFNEHIQLQVPSFQPPIFKRINVAPALQKLSTAEIHRILRDDLHSRLPQNAFVSSSILSLHV